MRMIAVVFLVGGMVLCARFAEPSEQPDNAALAAQAFALLKQHCAACHDGDVNGEGRNRGGFGYTLHRDQLVEHGQFVPGNVKASNSFQRILSGSMPPGKQGRLKPAEIAILKAWIEADAPAWVRPAGQRDFYSDESIAKTILADLKPLSDKQRKFTRYFTATHLYNSGRADEDMETGRLALGKLLNSLSWQARITVPQSVNQFIYRIDLRDFKWTASSWERVLREYPYKSPSVGEAPRLIAKWTGTDTAVIRADWFVATASQAPLYSDLLQLPATDRALERMLQVDVMQNLQDESAVRAGFNDSGVSKNNRMIERHDAAYGAYWRSYDFADNKGRQSLFEHPLGPTNGETSFKQDGGEMIWQLPNGLHAYMIVDKNGKRIDKAPVEVVGDSQRPDQKVTTGLSCMSCHARGFLPKGDQVRGHVVKNQQAFNKADVETVLALYPPRERLQGLIDDDNAKYAAALAKLGVKLDAGDPVNVVTRRYEATLDPALAAAELGLTLDAFRQWLANAPGLARVLGPLALKTGSVQRDVFQDAFPGAMALFSRTAAPVKMATANNVYEPTSGGAKIVSMALSNDGDLGAVGRDDKSVVIFDTKDGSGLRRLDKHRGHVNALAFSPNGLWLASGGADRMVGIWDLEQGTLNSTLMGHTDSVRCLAFSPNGSLVVSGSDDRSLRLWDWVQTKEITALYQHTGPVLAVAWAADGKWFVSASQDGTLRQWDAKTGKSLRVFEGHVGAVLAVAVSPDGRTLLSGGNDKTVRLWNVATTKEKMRLTGHVNSVVAVAFTANGTKCVSAASQFRQADALFRQWDLATGKEERRWGENHEGSVSNAALGADFTLTGGGFALRRLNHD